MHADSNGEKPKNLDRHRPPRDPNIIVIRAVSPSLFHNALLVSSEGLNFSLKEETRAAACPNCFNFSFFFPPELLIYLFIHRRNGELCPKPLGARCYSYRFPPCKVSIEKEMFIVGYMVSLHIRPHSSWCSRRCGTSCIYPSIPLPLVPKQLANIKFRRSTGVPKSSSALRTREPIPQSKMTGLYSRSWRCPTAPIRTTPLFPSRFQFHPSYRRQCSRSLNYSPLMRFYTDRPRSSHISRFTGKRPPPSRLHRSSVSRAPGRSTRTSS